MPKRTDIRSILIIGSGPIVMGQAWEFDLPGFGRGSIAYRIVTTGPMTEVAGHK